MAAKKKTTTSKAPARKAAKKAPERTSTKPSAGARDDEVFETLRDLLARHAAELVVQGDGQAGYGVETPPSQAHPEGLFFGGVRAGKSYVSFHFFPVYTHPELLRGLSPGLRRRMQGKSCFNFKRLEPGHEQELAQLVQAGLALYRELGWL